MSTNVLDATDTRMKELAAKLEEENPLWMIVFGVYTKQFVAYPRFPAPARTMAVATYPPALVTRMRDIEIAFGVTR